MRRNLIPILGLLAMGTTPPPLRSRLDPLALRYGWSTGAVAELEGAVRHLATTSTMSVDQVIRAVEFLAVHTNPGNPNRKELRDVINALRDETTLNACMATWHFGPKEEPCDR